MAIIENRPFNELRIGDHASLVRTLTEGDIPLFAAISSDVNPAHVDEDYAKSDMIHEVIAHGMWSGALISTVLGTMLPGFLGSAEDFLALARRLGNLRRVEISILLNQHAQGPTQFAWQTSVIHCR